MATEGMTVEGREADLATGNIELPPADNFEKLRSAMLMIKSYAMNDTRCATDTNLWRIYKTAYDALKQSGDENEL